MCLLCVEVVKGKMTSREVARAYRETVIPDGHLGELLAAISEGAPGGVDGVAEELNRLIMEQKDQA